MSKCKRCKHIVAGYKIQKGYLCEPCFMKISGIYDAIHNLQKEPDLFDWVEKL